MSLEVIYREVGRLVVESGRTPTPTEYLHILLNSHTVEEVLAMRAKVQAGEIDPTPPTEIQRVFFEPLRQITVAEMHEIRRRVQANARAAAPSVAS